jgi:hypothetical protein
MKFEDLIGTGRIHEISAALKTLYKVDDTRKLPESVKLNALLETLQITAFELDSLIAENAPVFRTIKGHAFEIVFEYLMASAGYNVTDVGGDGDVDLIVNGHKLQLKTPNVAGTKNFTVEYKTHKTHGAKSENESINYYHSVEHFADYLVGLISYEPLNILFLEKKELPLHPGSALHIVSPFKINWQSHIGLNNYKRIGVTTKALNSKAHFPEPSVKELLPKTAARLNLKTSIILDTIFSLSNFRIWDMSIRGWAREVVVNNLFQKSNLHFVKPSTVRISRADKSDFALQKKDHSTDFFQVKGLSTNNCRFHGTASVVGVETQLTRGRVNDHATQSRLYLKSDFDYLLICIDPPLVKKFNEQIGIHESLQWKFYCIPTEELKPHATFTHRLKSLQLFNIVTLRQYEISDKFFKRYL